MSLNSKNSNMDSSKIVKKIRTLINEQKSSRVDWIVITSSELTSSTLQKVTGSDFVVKCIKSSKDEYGRFVINSTELRRAAGQSWLFNLVFDIHSLNYDQTQIDKCLMGLKDLGFCKIFNLHKSNNTVLHSFCENYNVSYQASYTD